jgi:hypothetical protein
LTVISIYKSYYVSEQKTKNINVYNLFKHKHNTRIKDKMSLLWNIIMCTKFDIYVFIKEKKNLTCNHSPVNFVNAIYQCYLNQIICVCTINIGSAIMYPNKKLKILTFIIYLNINITHELKIKCHCCGI